MVVLREDARGGVEIWPGQARVSTRRVVLTDLQLRLTVAHDGKGDDRGYVPLEQHQELRHRSRHATLAERGRKLELEAVCDCRDGMLEKLESDECRW